MDLEEIKAVLMEVYTLEVEMELAYEEGWQDAIKEAWYELFGEELDA